MGWELCWAAAGAVAWRPDVWVLQQMQVVQVLVLLNNMCIQFCSTACAFWARPTSGLQRWCHLHAWLPTMLAPSFPACLHALRCLVLTAAAGVITSSPFLCMC